MWTPKTSAPCILLLGEPGNGKTFSLGTLAKEVDKFFYLYTDPGGDESLLDSLEHYKIPIDKVHWCYVAPASEGWDTLEELARKVNSFDYETLAKIKSGINKNDHRQMFKIIEALANFTCERTGESFGPVDKFPSTYGLAFDSLTGLNKIAKDSTVGAKPTLHQGEWGIAMSMEENLIRKFCSDIPCTRTMIGHLDKQMDEIAGRMTFQVSLLGQKLAPQIPHLFSDVVYAWREGEKFYWSTTDNRIALKTRNLEFGDKLSPSFIPAIKKWRARQEYAAKVSVPEKQETLTDPQQSLTS